MRGYKKLLTLNDLFPLDQTMARDALGKRLETHLEAHPTRGKKFGLSIALAKVLAIPILLPVAPRIALLGFNLCQPFLINSLPGHLQSLRLRPH
jgi:ATP-binding cassette, subfamily C (CFTR/MRP), member 1